MVVVRAFEALWPSVSDPLFPDRYLFGAGEGPSGSQLLQNERRETDRSRFVAHMRAAALLAEWRREGHFEAAQAPALYAWRVVSVTMAVAGLVGLSDLLPRPVLPAVTRDLKARLEALGALPAFPVLTGTNIPDLALRPLYRTRSGDLCLVEQLEEITLEGTTTEPVEFGSVLEAFRSICSERNAPEPAIPVWVRHPQHASFVPPISALIWPWVGAF